MLRRVSRYRADYARRRDLPDINSLLIGEIQIAARVQAQPFRLIQQRLRRLPAVTTISLRAGTGIERDRPARTDLPDYIIRFVCRVYIPQPVHGYSIQRSNLR